MYQRGDTMLVNFKVKGYKTFVDEVEISFIGNKKIRNKDYVFLMDDLEILKSAIVYGPNNTGKSNLLEALKLFKKISLAKQVTEDDTSTLNFNFFSDEKQIDFEITFIEEKYYNYSFSFNDKQEIINEKLIVNQEDIIFDRNDSNNVKDIQTQVNIANLYKTDFVIKALPAKYKEHSDNFRSFLQKLIFLDNIFDFKSFIEDVGELEENEFKRLCSVVKSADISIDDLKFNKEEKSHYMLKLFSNYSMKNKKFKAPSALTDSSGTSVFMYYMANIIKLMKTGGIIVIDEIDQSLHTLLTKSIISIFNSEDNTKLQLLSTTHDLQLLDAKYLFRKDQIWLTYKDDQEVYLYSLDKFRSNIENQIRNNTIESYLKGLFGALPNPQIESALYDEKL